MMRTSLTRMGRVSVLVIGVASVSIAAAAPDAHSPSARAAAVAELSADSPAARLAAEQTLLRDASFTLADAEAAAAAPGLSAETRARLLRVASVRFRVADRPAMGISFGTELDGRIALGATHEPFDAARKLKAGDLIDAIDGRPVRRDPMTGRSAQVDLRTEIMSRLPGEVMHITGHRDGQPFAADVTLGLWQDLGQRVGSGQQVPAADIDSGWHRRAARLGLLASPRSIDATGPDNPAIPGSGFVEPIDRPVLVAGARRSAVARTAGPNIAFINQQRVRVQGADLNDIRVRANAQLRQTRNLRDQERAQLADTRERINAKLQTLETDLSDAQREMVTRQLGVLRARERDLNTAIERREHAIRQLQDRVQP